MFQLPCLQECITTGLYAQSARRCIRAWINLAWAMATEVGETTLLDRLSGWCLWKSCFSGIHCWLQALEKRYFPLVFEWNGYQLVFSKKCHGHESCLWRVRYYLYSCIFLVPLWMEMNYFLFLFWWKIIIFYSACLSFLP